MPLVWRVGACSAVLAATVLAVACSSTPPRSPAQTGADEAVANRVYSALNADPTYFYRHVDVRVDNGIVDLRGYVWNAEAIYRARQIARDVPGVRQVVTNLELQIGGLGGHGR
jgi:osmotically-inducible protein OsmY